MKKFLAIASLLATGVIGAPTEPSSFREFNNIFTFLDYFGTPGGQQKIKEDIKAQADTVVNGFTDSLTAVLADYADQGLPNVNKEIFKISEGLNAAHQLYESLKSYI
ncbi:hypothetical protein CONCODRAFT_166638 [Conidiobolus coronatus NRRL 28638]|uniref:Uncharacterized protein n=1 Tax=Conidiobolus coronatus (strain ATCC 28846 / CBS 209.66 / NRRL 28638) TaxID=796925 RepID=A0A137NZQ0_CONC2|nr:hypothetical protein CONCODRAFT_166638 [Conidiobolus coronatus NRRL 28638]|eukprot:KXN68285.1 hypothetical protein CONCODRAFT_166638 [Conidiobolus coronatus NRRL 28638]